MGTVANATARGVAQARRSAQETRRVEDQRSLEETVKVQEKRPWQQASQRKEILPRQEEPPKHKEERLRKEPEQQQRTRQPVHEDQYQSYHKHDGPTKRRYALPVGLGIMLFVPLGLMAEMSQNMFAKPWHPSNENLGTPSGTGVEWQQLAGFCSEAVAPGIIKESRPTGSNITMTATGK